MRAVEMEVANRLSRPEEAAKFSRQHLANTLWALATLEVVPTERLLKAVAQAIRERASDCNSQEISNTVWAFAKLSKLHCWNIAHVVSSSIEVVTVYACLRLCLLLCKRELQTGSPWKSPTMSGPSCVSCTVVTPSL